jgi:hypothetical protein
MRLALAITAVLLVSCSADKFGRSSADFPPPVPKDAPDGTYPTRSGWIVKDGRVAWVFEF